MNTRLDRRVTKLEGQLRVARIDPIESADERLKRAVLCTLSPDQLEAMIDHARQLQNDPCAKPNPEQAAALAIYVQQYQVFKTTGELMVDGWPAEV